MFFFFFFFEQEIIDIISKSLLDGESIEVGKINTNFAYDYVLPKGCKQLGLPPKTAIEVKKTLVPGTLSVLINDAKNAHTTGDFNMFLVLYEEGVVHQDWIPKEICDFVLFLSKAELENRAASVRFVHIANSWENERDLRIAKLRKEFRESQSTLFVGAGLSCSLGVPGWNYLLKQLTKRIRNKIKDYPHYQSVKDDSGGSFLITARYLNSAAARNEIQLIQEIRKKLYKSCCLNSDYMDAVIDLLKENRIGEVVTYNYDTLLEQRMSVESIKNSSVDCQNKRVRRAIPVMHVHGVIHPKDTDYDRNVVLSEDGYHQLYCDSYDWANVAQLYALTHTTCIFTGLSMKDPSLRRLLDIAYRQGSGDVDHYAFLLRNEFRCHKETEDVFSQMGVNIIWCKDRDDVPVQIRRVV